MEQRTTRFVTEVEDAVWRNLLTASRLGTLSGHREREPVNAAAVPQICPRTAETLSRT
jgi:hypothetical protein